MPFIDSKLSIPVSEDKKEIIKARLGASMPLISKSESWLMVGFDDNYSLYFKGNQDGATAMVTVSLFGKADKASYDKLTAEICSVYEEVLDISKDRIYVKYEEVGHWGWNGQNF